MSATTQAEKAADIALAATGLAIDAKKQAEQHAQTAERLAPPDPHAAIVQELAGFEASVLLRVGPKRNRWSDLQRYDEQLVEFEQRREQLNRQIGELRGARNNEPTRVAAAIDAWIVGGSQGERPQSQVATLDRRSRTRRPSTRRSGSATSGCSVSGAEHVSRNRQKMSRDVRKHVEAAAGEYVALVDALEQKRQELLELRQTEVWVNVYPSSTLAGEPNTMALVGAKRRLQSAHLPGIQSGIIANDLFMLRADAGFCQSVATLDQAAIERGVSTAELSKSDARWMDDSRVDLVGPAFDAAWGGSDQEKQQAQRVAQYAEQTRKRLWGE